MAMEGIGPRLGRVSSRYSSSPGPTAPAFNGPVRKWRRQWVSSEPANNAAGNKGRHQHLPKQNATPILLCRWTRLASGDSDTPPKRRVRYAPVIVLEEAKKEACREVDDDAQVGALSLPEENMMVSCANPFSKSQFSDSFLQGKKGMKKQKAQRNKGQLDLQLSFENPEC